MPLEDHGSAAESNPTIRPTNFMSEHARAASLRKPAWHASLILPASVSFLGCRGLARAGDGLFQTFDHVGVLSTDSSQQVLAGIFHFAQAFLGTGTGGGHTVHHPPDDGGEQAEEAKSESRDQNRLLIAMGRFAWIAGLQDRGKKSSWRWSQCSSERGVGAGRTQQRSCFSHDPHTLMLTIFLMTMAPSSCRARAPASIF